MCYKVIVHKTVVHRCKEMPSCANERSNATIVTVLKLLTQMRLENIRELRLLGRQYVSHTDTKIQKVVMPYATPEKAGPS